MKRKSFKKALAGISAAAMLVSAMPMTLIADAYSYTNINGISDFLLAEGKINADAGQDSATGDFSYATGDRSFVSNVDVNLNAYKITDYAKYQINEVYATAANGDITSVTSAEYDFDAAADDIIEEDPDFIKGVTFDQTGSPKRGDANFNAKFGTIKTITLSMPVNNAGVNAGVETTEYEDIEFTVVRDEDDIVKSFSNNALNEARHIILAGAGNQIDLTGDSVDESLKTQLSYTGDIDINLNGNTLKTKAGIQVSGKKMRIWGGGTISSTATDSTLAAYGSSSVIELYDNVKIDNQDTTATKAAISGEGTLIMCGDNVIVQHAGDTNTRAIGADSTGKTGIATFIAGDYMYNDTAVLFNGLDETERASSTAGKNFFKPNGTASGAVAVSGLQKFSTMKIHNYNKYGFEVKDRTGDFSNSTNYLDVDPVTPGDQYGYEPVRNADDNGITLSTTASATVIAKNEGQLFFLAQQINNDKFEGTDADSPITITANLKNTSFDFSNAPLNWEPIDASDIILKINGKYTDTFEKYSVIKNLKVNVAAGDAGFVSNTKANVQNEIKNLGFENSSVTGNGSVGTVVGFGDSVAIENVYVNNSAVKSAVKGGNYNGTIAGTLYNSKIDHTYSAADVQPVAIISGSTVTYLAMNGVKTVAGMTNFYDKGLVTPAAGSSSATYLVGETSKHFKDGTVAFMLNGHNPAQATEGDPEGFFDTSSTYNGSCSVDGYNTAPYNKDYDQDIFGQDLSSTGKGTSYPTFIKITDITTIPSHVLASNRVFREIVTKCTGDKEKWTATNANFLNAEVDKTKGGHTDANADDICDTCGAYKISEKNFDKSLIPFLSQETSTKYGAAPDGDTTPFEGDGWLNKTEIDAIEEVVIDLTTEDTSNLNVSDIVNAINAEDANGNAAPTLKGISVLNQKLAVTKLVPAEYGEGSGHDTGYVYSYEIIVDDAVLCRYVANASDADAAKKEGFLVATNATEANTYAPKSGGSMQSVTNATAADKKDFYVFADKSAGKSMATAQFTFDTAHNESSPKFVDFKITFKGGVKHNDVEDYKADGSLDAVKQDDASGEAVLIKKAAANTSKHTYVGANCGCVIKTEECRNDTDTITPKTHTMKCDICAYEASTEPHAFEIMFTIGNVTVKRCMGCGYVTAVKDTNITTGTPVLSLRKATDGATGAETTYWRQTYDFNITVGDGNLVSYGVLYKKNPTASIGVDSSKLKKGADKYFDATTGALNTAVLAADGANYTSKKGITTSGTYRVNVDMANSDEAVQIVGYVVYKSTAGAVTVKVTDLTEYSFEDLAKAEMEACNFVTEAGMTTTNNLKPQFIFDYDLGENYTFVQYGLLVTRNADKPVTEKTVLADAVAYDKTLITSKICYTNRKVAASVKSVKYGANVSMAAGETATVRGYAVITDQYGLTWEIYSDVQSHTAS